MNIIDPTNPSVSPTSGEKRPARPAWAVMSDRDDCGGTRHDNPAAVTHWSAWERADLGGRTILETALARWDDYDHPEESLPTQVAVEAPGLGDSILTLADFEALGRWILDRAAEYRAAVETEARPLDRVTLHFTGEEAELIRSLTREQLAEVTAAASEAGQATADAIRRRRDTSVARAV